MCELLGKCFLHGLYLSINIIEKVNALIKLKCSLDLDKLIDNAKYWEMC